MLPQVFYDMVLYSPILSYCKPYLIVEYVIPILSLIHVYRVMFFVCYFTCWYILSLVQGRHMPVRYARFPPRSTWWMYCFTLLIMPYFLLGAKVFSLLRRLLHFYTLFLLPWYCLLIIEYVIPIVSLVVVYCSTCVIVVLFISWDLFLMFLTLDH